VCTGNHIFSNKGKVRLILHSEHSENDIIMTQWATGCSTEYLKLRI